MGMKCFAESLKESLAQDPKIQFRWEGEWGFKSLPYISFTLFGPRVSLNDLALIKRLFAYSATASEKESYS